LPHFLQVAFHLFGFFIGSAAFVAQGVPRLFRHRRSNRPPPPAPAPEPLAELLLNLRDFSGTRGKMGVFAHDGSSGPTNPHSAQVY
jgi:hypothetical protein